MNNFTLIDKAVKKYNMLKMGSRIVVGVSGGADSMCLLHYLISVRDALNLQLTAAHINHNLRGDEAKRDELFVQDFCKKNNVEFALKSVNVSELSKKEHMGTEEYGRKARYEFFKALAADDGFIATAHTASDNAETVLFNMTRGTGLNGLCGILPVRENIIRPLIFMTRTDVESYCKAFSVPFVTDSSNLKDEYSRNKIRHTALPCLKEINGNAEHNISKLSQSLKEDNDYLLSVAKKALENHDKNGYCVKKINSLAIPIKKRSIILMADKAGLKTDSRHIDIIIELLNGKGAVDINSDFEFRTDGKLCNFFKKKANTSEKTCNSENNWSYTLKNTEEIKINNKKYTFIPANSDEIIQKFKNCKILFNNAVNCDIINDNTLIRTRREGDFFTKAGRGCTKSLKKLLNEMKFDHAQRAELVLIANGSEVLWIDGIGVSEKAKVSNKNSDKCIFIKTEENQL